MAVMCCSLALATAALELAAQAQQQVGLQDEVQHSAQAAEETVALAAAALRRLPALCAAQSNQKRVFLAVADSGCLAALLAQAAAMPEVPARPLRFVKLFES